MNGTRGGRNGVEATPSPPLGGRRGSLGSASPPPSPTSPGSPHNNARLSNYLKGLDVQANRGRTRLGAGRESPGPGSPDTYAYGSQRSPASPSAFRSSLGAAAAGLVERARRASAEDLPMFGHQGQGDKSGNFDFSGSVADRLRMVSKLAANKPHRAAAAQLPRGNFDWLPQLLEDDVANHAATTITATEIASKHGCPEEHVIGYLRREIEEAESCQSLPFTVLMIVAFTFAIISHDPVVPINSVEDSLMHDIISNANYAYTSPHIGHRDLMNVNSYADFWSWMIHGLIPLMFSQEFPVSEDLDTSDPTISSRVPEVSPDEWGYVLNYNRMIGGVRVRQERSSASSCEKHRFVAPPCVGGLGYELFPETWVAFTTTDPQQEFWLWSQDPADALTEQAVEKELEGWLNDGTRKIEIALPVFNAEYEVLTIAYVNFWWSRGGHVWKRVLPMSTYSSWWHGPHNYILDFIWTSCIFWVTLSEVLAIMRKRKVSGWHGVWSDYVRIWTVIDWISVIIAYAVIILFSFRLVASADLSEKIRAVSSIDPVTDRISYRAQIQDLLVSLDDEVKGVYELRLIVGVYPVVVILRLFKAFSAQASLSIVTRTLKSAGIDLVHFLLVFCSIFISGAVGGILLFGREVDGFTTLDRSMVTLFRAMMTDFDWDDMVVIGRYEAGVFFVIFMIIMVMLMLNMLLAIVMDAYATEKEKLGTADTLWEETRQNWQRWRGHQKGLMMSLPDVLRCLNKEKENRTMGMSTIFGSDATYGRGSAYGSDASSVPRVSSRILGGDSVQIGSHMASVAASSGMVPVESVTGERKTLKRSHSGTASQTSVEGLRRWFASRRFGASRSRSFDSLLVSEAKVIITMDKLKVLCPKMQTEQAITLLEDAIMDFWNQNKESVDVEENLRQIRKVDRVTQLAAKKIHLTFESLFPEAPAQKARQAVVVFEKGKSEMSNASSAAESELEGTYPDRKMQFSETLTTLGNRLTSTRFHKSQDLIDTGHLHLNCVSLFHGPDSDFTTLKSIEEVPMWSFVKILDHEEAVLNSCRLAGIGTEHDAKRLECLGEIARCIQQDPRDNTVKCRFNEGQLSVDVWMPLGALTVLKPYKKVKTTVEEKIFGPKKVVPPEIANKIQELQQEVAVGKNTVTEAMKALSELQWRNMKEQEEKTRIVSKFKMLHKKTRALTKEHTKLQEELRRQDDRLSVVAASKDEYLDLVHNMVDENQRLKEKLAGILASQMDYNYQALAIVPSNRTSRAPSRAPPADMAKQNLTVMSRRHGPADPRGRKYSEGAETESSASVDPVNTINLIADDLQRMRDEVVMTYQSSNNFVSSRDR
mmetsp:Transcript_38886/g.91562  ORF Transcript_38886/g.91562 Transcript_38886/m.91562 type:complete len:1329 (+) Transcript_38886:201-4187(+)|eukprot:CAMPEP_0178395760 /NCGR_PEP_ID=MMETSP0689_2-20121128/13384_1 /TAXON_ID=160604 /ORGANISM="Amphidinium massartii, Strain CS-259" /LENGTH=1328 /DNA_ID=CAMNT_0020016423 /DNA_START=115 /DNA_END=4101 /DNA_ORIENTATION=+